MADDAPLILPDDERQALIRLARQTLDYARYPMAPRLDPLKAILVKLDPPPYAPPPSPAGAGPSSGRYRRSGDDGDWEIDV